MHQTQRHLGHGKHRLDGLGKAGESIDGRVSLLIEEGSPLG